jgi:hypothetical protein
VRSLYLLFFCAFFVGSCFAKFESLEFKTLDRKNEILVDGFGLSSDAEYSEIEKQLIDRVQLLKAKTSNVELHLDIDEKLKALAQDPQHPLHRLISQLEMANEGRAQVKYVPKVSKKFSEYYTRLKKSLSKNYRLAFTLVRGTFQWGAATLSLRISQDSSLALDLVMGAWVGFLSGNVQFFSDYIYGQMTKKNILGSSLFKLLKKMGLEIEDIKQKQIENISNWIEKFGRWYAFEVIFLSVLQAGWSVMSDHQKLLDLGTTLNIVSTSALATVAQGSWDLTLTTLAEKKKIEGEDEKSTQFRTMLGLLFSSVLSTGILSVLRLAHVPHSEWAFLAMGSAGFYQLWKINHEKKKAQELVAGASNNLSCQMSLLFR